MNATLKLKVCDNSSADWFPHCSVQWVFSAGENRLNATPITATKKLAETATHKTSSNGLFITSLRDSDASHLYIVADNGTESASYWIGLFIA